MKSKAKENSKEESKGTPGDSSAITDRDFKDPKIIEFKTATESDEKPSWRDLEKDIQDKYPKLKLLYARMDDKVGQMAFSNQNIDTESLDALLAATITSAKFDYTFETPSEDDLKKFWEQHGSHFEMISKQKLRRLNKKKRDERAGGDQTSNKRAKNEEEERQYTIAGVTYANINKVKSKAKAIMNVKEDGQKLEGYEEEFMKHIIANHPKHEAKMKDFTHFSVDEHADYSNTR